MFVTSNQFYVLMACIAYGGISGAFLSFLSPLTKILKSRWIKAVVDFFCFIVITFGYIVYSFALKFPSFRIFMPIAVFVGIILYMKSFNIILAKMIEKIYNKIRKHKGNTKNDG